MAGGTVYAAGFYSAVGGGSAVYALEAATGTRRWDHPIAGSGVMTVALDAGTVYASSNESSGTSAVFALDAASGAQLWTYRAHSVQTLAVADGTVYAATTFGVIAIKS